MQKYRNHILIAVFVLCITAPLLAMIFKLDQSALLQENRERVKFPSLSLDKVTLRKFPHEFYGYFRDNFGFRDTFIRLNFLIRRSLLHETEFNDVLVGKNGWLFYLGEKEMDDARGITEYEEQTLKKWTALFELKRRWLAARGIRYLIVIVPSKATIYGENLPTAFRTISNITALDEFIDYDETHSGVEILDLRPALLRAKSKERLYYKTDTHWNQYGALVAYQEIMNVVSRSIPSRPPDTLADFTIERRLENGGDLALLLGGADFFKEEHYDLIPKRARLASRVEMNSADPRTYAMRQDNRRLPRALVFRDSFFDEIIPFMSEHFQYIRYYRQHWDGSIPITDVVAETHPDIVIEEFAERRIKMDIGNFIPPE